MGSVQVVAGDGGLVLDDDLQRAIIDLDLGDTVMRY